MIGRQVCRILKEREAKVIHKHGWHYSDGPPCKYDLTDLDKTWRFIRSTQPDYIIHLAGYNGGIKFNKEHPMPIFFRTSRMALNVIECAALAGVKKVVSIISSCAYPDSGDHPLYEGTLWSGMPNSSVECHGLSKRILDAASRQVYKELGLPYVCCVLTNCFGEHDRFHPDRSKVVGGLIKRFVEARDNNLPYVECWGTGKPVRELMYAADAGESIVQVLERYDNPDMPINIGSRQEISIKELVDLIVKIVNYKGKVVWLTEKGDGQMRKFLDSSTMQTMLNVQITPFEEALTRTIRWYENNKELANVR